MPGLLGFLGFGGPANVQQQEETSINALPASWYTSKEIFELERRAVFLKNWLLVTHKTRFAQSGDWLRYDVAGFAFVICRDREGNINGFHNVCRHRAYPVVEGNRGTARIFACKYHGWSYSLTGKLAKAPGYQELEGFDKSKNNLFPIHVRVDKNGFVWVNLDGKPEPEIAWSDDSDEVDQEGMLKEFNLNDYGFDHTWEQNSKYNWKILAEHYNEYSRSQNSQTDIPTDTSVKPEDAQNQHDSVNTIEQQVRNLRISATHYFPNSSVIVSPNFFFVQRFEPFGPQDSKINYEVFRHRNATEEDFQLVSAIYKRTMLEDKAFVTSGTHPSSDQSHLFFQRTYSDLVKSHQKHEQIAKQEIWPARQILPDSNKGAISQEDIDFCSGLACTPGQQNGLAW